MLYVLISQFFFVFMLCQLCTSSFFFFNDTATTEIYTLSLHDALPIYRRTRAGATIHRTTPQRYEEGSPSHRTRNIQTCQRSEEHTSELQSQSNLVCRLLLEKKKKKQHIDNQTSSKSVSYVARRRATPH